MCIILCVERQEDLPSLETLKSAELLNGDGAGIAWIEKDLVHFEKGIGAERIHEIIKSGIKVPIVIHFRIATVGGVNKKLCHPFPITSTVQLAQKGVSKSVLFHNGHISDWKDMCLKTVIANRIPFPDPNGDWSDSRALAWLIHVYGTSWLNLITGSRIAVLNHKGLRKFGDGWVKHKNIDCSNSGLNNNFNTHKAWKYGRVWRNGGWVDEDEIESIEKSATELVSNGKHWNYDDYMDAYEEEYGPYGAGGFGGIRARGFDKEEEPKITSMTQMCVTDHMTDTKDIEKQKAELEEFNKRVDALVVAKKKIKGGGEVIIISNDEANKLEKELRDMKPPYKDKQIHEMLRLHKEQLIENEVAIVREKLKNAPVSPPYTEKELREIAIVSLENKKRNPIPTKHLGEEMKELFRVADDNQITWLKKIRDMNKPTNNIKHLGDSKQNTYHKRALHLANKGAVEQSISEMMLEEA